MDYTQWVKWGAVISTARGVELRGEKGEEEEEEEECNTSLKGGGDAFIFN